MTITPIKLTHIHPFPARMASEIVFERLARLQGDAIVLDPMSGSGTVLRAAAEMGHGCIGFDLDPLAVLMARVWTTPLNDPDLTAAARDVVDQARELAAANPPWMDGCRETQAYADYWFAPKQADQMRRLALVLAGRIGPVSDALRIALSRIIVTKERGASIARDASHSRPHRVFFDNDYDVFGGFLQSAARLAVKLHGDRLVGPAVVNVGDARRMHHLPSASVDIVITSPPYLNAIDYLRGHRLALVWLGSSVRDLRTVRAASIGTEISKPLSTDVDAEHLLRNAGDLGCLPQRERGMISRYAGDIYLLMRELSRVLRAGGEALLVVGNSCLKGVAISNAAINVAAAERAGLRLRGVVERALPSAHRYLPPPSGEEGASLAKRMRTETVLAFATL